MRYYYYYYCCWANACIVCRLFANFEPSLTEQNRINDSMNNCLSRWNLFIFFCFTWTVILYPTNKSVCSDNVLLSELELLNEFLFDPLPLSDEWWVLLSDISDFLCIHNICSDNCFSYNSRNLNVNLPMVLSTR